MAMDPTPEAARQAARKLASGLTRLGFNELEGLWRRRNRPDPLDMPQYQSPEPFDAEGYLANLPPQQQTAALDGAAALDPASVAAADPMHGEVQTETVPADLFDSIVGLEHEKRVLLNVITTSVRPRPAALLVGPPGTAKSVFLEECSRVQGYRFVGMAAKGTTVSGLRGVLQDPDVRGLLLDEVDKASVEVQNYLLGIVNGRNSYAVSGEVVDQEIDVAIIGSANDITHLTAPFRDRFEVLRLQPYSEQEMHTVITAMLIKRHGAPQKRAETIGLLVAKAGGGLRDAVRVNGFWQDDPELAQDVIARIAREHGKPIPSLHTPSKPEE